MDPSPNLRKHFPPIKDEEWTELIHEDLSWEPVEGIRVAPYYRRSPSTPAHLFHHRTWLIRTDVDLNQATEAVRAGAEALGFLLHNPIRLPKELPIGRLPLFFRGSGVTPELIPSLCERIRSDGLSLDQLQGAVVLPSTSSPRAAKGTGLRTQSIDLEVWHNQGATHIQELACGLGQFSDLMADIAPNCTAEHIYFRVPVGERYILDIARLRALRMGAAEILRAYQAPILPIYIVCTPSQRYHSALDPDTHLVRQTLQYTASIIGGGNVIVSYDMDHSLRMQQVLRYEGKLGIAADAAAGSWMIEHLTESLAHAAWTLFQKIESRGGMHKVEAWMEQKIQDMAEKRSRSVLSGDIPVVGVNTYLSDQVKKAVPQEHSITVPLEAVRLRALGINPRVRIGEIRNPWLDQLLALCACTLHDDDVDLTITETVDGFLVENREQQQISLQSGDSLPFAAERLFTLIRDHAS